MDKLRFKSSNQLNEHQLFSIINEIKASFNTSIISDKRELDERKTQLEWIIDNVEEDKVDAQYELNIINTQLDDIVKRISELETSLSSVSSIDDISKLSKFIPINKFNSIISKYKDNSRTIKYTICSCKEKIEVGTKRCPHCYSDVQSLNSYVNNEISRKEGIDHKDTLEEAMACYQGKQNRTFSQEFIDYIDRSIAERSIDPKSIKRDTLKVIIKRGRYSEHFCDLNLLHHRYTGAVLPNISHLEGRLRHRNQLMKDVYKELHPNHKGKYLHGQYLLKVMLQMENFKYNKSDFSSELKMRKVTMRHNIEVKEVCVILKKRYPELNWDFTFTV